MSRIVILGRSVARSVAGIPPRRLAALAGLAALAVLPLWGGARLLIALSAEAPVREAQQLRGALESARRARAKQYATVDLAAAEAAAEGALREYYGTVARKTGFLRYDAVRRRLNEALDKTDHAWLRATRRTEAARASALQAIQEGRSEVGEADEVLRTAPIGAVVRSNLARARVAIGIATARWKAGDYTTALHEATFAKSTSREIQRRASSFIQTYTKGESAQKWARWVEDTIGLSRRTGTYVVVVDKLRHKCHLYRGGSLVRSFSADLGGPLWDKMRAGDRATPEGMYKVVQKRPLGQTTYYKALLINYPNEEDRAEFALAKKRGWVPRYAAIGGLIEIHGEGGRREDWTLGCVALANKDMDELFRVVAVGTPVTIVGTITESGAVSNARPPRRRRAFSG